MFTVIANKQFGQYFDLLANVNFYGINKGSLTQKNSFDGLTENLFLKYDSTKQRSISAFNYLK